MLRGKKIKQHWTKLMIKNTIQLSKEKVKDPVR